MLHGIREGVLGYDKNERILLANDLARQLLHLPPEIVGRPLRQVLPARRLAGLSPGAADGRVLRLVKGHRLHAATQTARDARGLRTGTQARATRRTRPQ